MAKERGVIQEILGNTAIIRVQRSAACKHCNSRGQCSTGADQQMLVEAENNMGAEPDSQVEISVPTRSLLKLCTLVYLLPIFTLITGAYIGSVLAPVFHTQITTASIIGGGFALGLTFYVLRRLDRAAKAGGKYQPKITRILP